jgi:hypothetical protein
LNKKNRAGRDMLMRGSKFNDLVDATIEHARDFNARMLSDVLWSFATLQELPSLLLEPLLMRVYDLLQADAFNPSSLPTTVWALARLKLKPVKLLEQLEAQAVPRIGSMNVQNMANMLWGFAELNYECFDLLPPLTAALLARDLGKAKPVEVSNIAFALGRLGGRAPTPEYAALLHALAARAGKDVSKFTSRQLSLLLWATARLKAAEGLPAGLLDEVISTVRSAHEVRPLLATDAKSLEESLVALGKDASWVKRSEMLNTWKDMAAGGRSVKPARSYTTEELRAVFDAIDTDKSGDIDREELISAIKAIQGAMKTSDIETMLDFGDEDGDAQVSFEEFAKILRGERKSKAVA